MLFTSLTFALFLISLFILYWFVCSRNLKFQNLLLLTASYIFYGWWDWRFLLILALISFSSYSIALLIQSSEKKNVRSRLLFIGLFVNIGSLVVFKYFNFFADSLIQFASLFGISFDQITLTLILPVGISFYVFLSLSYILDVYKRNFIAERNLINVFLSLSFFPIILAGPIQRPKTLLPQIKNTRVFNYNQATDGLKQILWGIFMKSVIADNCSVYADLIFKDHEVHSGSTLIIGALLFTVQIYSDFAGYSNIAIGLGKLFGFNIMKNFAFPYFSRDITEFWKKWNISLTTWFRDYVFLPIAFSLTRRIKPERILLFKKDLIIYTIGITVTWCLTGLWHGANYTFIAWGAIQGSFLVLYQATMKPKKRLLKLLNIKYNNKIYIFIETLFTFTIIVFSWIFFRAEDLGTAFRYISGIFSQSLFSLPSFRPNGPVILLVVIFFVIEWFGRNSEYAIQDFLIKSNKTFRWAMYYSIILTILFFAVTSQKFIYFQF